VGKKPRSAAALERAWRRTTPRLQLDLFEDRDAIAREALAERRAIERQLRERRESLARA
jgi:hypothetical protein